MNRTELFQFNFKTVSYGSIFLFGSVRFDNSVHFFLPNPSELALTKLTCVVMFFIFCLYYVKSAFCFLSIYRCGNIGCLIGFF
jgi:hypothetical protein